MLLVLVYTAGVNSDSLRIPSWSFIGPFACGKGEMGADVVVSPGLGGDGGIASVSSAPSAFARNGWAHQTNINGGFQNGVVQIPVNMPNPYCGWARGTLTLGQATCIAVSITGSIDEARVGNATLGIGWPQPIDLSAGSYRLFLHVNTNGYGQGFFRVSIDHCTAPRIVVHKMGPGSWQTGELRDVDESRSLNSLIVPQALESGRWARRLTICPI